MSGLRPSNADEIRNVIHDRLQAVGDKAGLGETVSVEWRNQLQPVQVISMPVDLLYYNPNTHRIRAQRTLDAERDRELDRDPFGPGSQAYLHSLLMGDPSDPSKRDPTFDALKEDLREHGQNDPGLITQFGVLINGNTRRAALKDLGQEHVRVGVLPADASLEDIQSVELSLQLRKDHKRDYSFMNFLLAIDERVAAGRPAAEIQRDFRIKATTFERSRWILTFVREAIERSKTITESGEELSMRLVDFETDQGKLEELYRKFTTQKRRAPEDADALREQRLLAIALGRSKTDLRLIEADFTERYMKGALPQDLPEASGARRIPGTTITAAAPSHRLLALRTLTDQALKARAIDIAPDAATPEVVTLASRQLGDLTEALNRALDKAGRNDRVIKKRLAAADRISDASEDLELALHAVAEARGTNNFDPDDLDEALMSLRGNLVKLARLVSRDGGYASTDGTNWLSAVATLQVSDG